MLLDIALHYTDAETGFQYLRARYYDPATGQFLTRDPIEAVTREPYGYVGGNPLNRTDPMGLCWGPGCWVEDAVDYVDDHKVGILNLDCSSDLRIAGRSSAKKPS